MMAVGWIQSGEGRVSNVYQRKRLWNSRWEVEHPEWYLDPDYYYLDMILGHPAMVEGER